MPLDHAPLEVVAEVGEAAPVAVRRGRIGGVGAARDAEQRERAVADTLTLAESQRYSGVISPHGWMDPGNWPRIWRLGGLAFPDSDTADNFVKVWKRYRPRQTPFSRAKTKRARPRCRSERV